LNIVLKLKNKFTPKQFLLNNASYINYISAYVVLQV